MKNNIKQIVWVDERTSDINIEGKPWNFQSQIEEAGFELVVCGEGKEKHKNNDERATTCLVAFKTALDRAYELNDQSSIAAFIVDIHIPISTLGIFSDELNEISTNSGADTGFQIAQYVLCNKRRDMSPYGDFFSKIPILFLSISKYTDLSHTRWMGKEFKPFNIENNCQFTHIEKVFESELTKNMAAWVQLIEK